MRQVTFHLSKDNTFTAEAVDLNSGRHHLWQVSRSSLPFLYPPHKKIAVLNMLLAVLTIVSDLRPLHSSSNSWPMT